MANLPTDMKPPPPPLTEWTAEVAALGDLIDRLGELIQLTATQATGKRQKAPPPWPRPVTAAERARRRRKREKHEALKSRLLPGR